MSSDPAKEFSAIQTVHAALDPLDPESRTRVLSYIASLLGINTEVAVVRTTTSGSGTLADNDGGADSMGDPSPAGAKGAPTYGSFAELYAAADPKTNAEKALVVGYWLQVCQSADSFTAALANKELTHLGHKIANITDAIDQMKSQKPMLMLQLKKSGSSQQARKLYKISHEGVKRVEAMIRG